VLVGLGIGRLDLRELRTAVRITAGGAVLLATTLAIGLVGIAREAFGETGVQGWRLLFVHGDYPYVPARWEELWLVGEHTSRPLNVLSAIGSALLVIGVCALVVRIPWARLVLTPLRSAGAMTLTLYTIHVLVTWRLAIRAAESPDPSAQLDSYGDWWLQVVVLCALATVWQRYVGRGPLESVVRLVSVPRAGVRERRNAPA